MLPCPYMERPANISKKAWELLVRAVDTKPGTMLIAAGILEHPELLADITLSIPLEISAIECVIDKEAAGALAAGAAHLKLKRLGDKKEYLVPREVVLEAFLGEIDYLE
jgi:hypothetical protein